MDLKQNSLQPLSWPACCQLLSHAMLSLNEIHASYTSQRTTQQVWNARTAKMN